MANPCTIVYPMADALQLRLGLYRPEGKPARIVLLDTVGRSYYPLPTPCMFRIPLQPKIVSSYYGAIEANIVIRIRENLHLHLVHLMGQGLLIAELFDAKKFPLNAVALKSLDNKPPHQVSEKIAKAVVARFQRDVEGTEWIPVGEKTNASAVDIGQS